MGSFELGWSNLTLPNFIHQKQNFCRAQRQIGEAASIHKDMLKRHNLLNLRSEYDRCKMPRIQIDKESETLKRLKEEVRKERERKEEILKLKKKRKEDKNKLKAPIAYFHFG